MRMDWKHDVKHLVAPDVYFCTPQIKKQQRKTTLNGAFFQMITSDY